jgi:preprotein translocase subunit SecG
MDGVRSFLKEWQLVLLVMHVGITAAMIVVILLQRSEGGGLGMGRTDALFSVRGQTNVLSRMTAIFAGAFFFLSLLMAWSVGTHTTSTTSIMDRAPPAGAPTTPGAPSPAPATPAAPTR